MYRKYPYIRGIGREQLEFTSLDMQIKEDSPARFVDLFVETQVRDFISFSHSDRALVGRPSFDPCTLMKLYLFGVLKKAYSSRELEALAEDSKGATWLLEGLTPDFRTISEFRKDNIAQYEAVFVAFRRFCSTSVKKTTGKDVYGGFKSIDGTKIRAQQSKDGCFTANKIDDRIQNDKDSVAEFKRMIDEISAEENYKKEDLETAKTKYQFYLDRLDKHEKIRDRIEKTGEQYSENDPDAKLMKSHYGGFNPCYNVQSAVDSESHLIEGILVTNKCTDHGLLKPTVDTLDKEEGKLVELVADNGYAQTEDMANSLENGIIPNTFLSKITDENGNKVHKKEIELAFPYEKSKITEEEKASTKAEDIKKCLRAGVAPDCYKDILTPVHDEKGNSKIVKTTSYDTVQEDVFGVDKMTDLQMIEKAKEGFFVRDLSNGRVYCPNGKILRKKSTKARGVIRFANKLACSKCPFKDLCFKSTKTTRWKEIDFSRNCRIKDAKFNPKGEEVGEQEEVSTSFSKARTVKREKQVLFIFKPDREKLDKRKCLSEHPFGTIKRYMSRDHFLLKGLNKVSAEAHLYALAYNFKRLINMFSVPTLLRAMGN